MIMFRGGKSWIFIRVVGTFVVLNIRYSKEVKTVVKKWFNDVEIER